MTRCADYYDKVFPRQVRESSEFEGCKAELSKSSKSEIFSYLGLIDKLEDQGIERRFAYANFSEGAARPIFREKSDDVREAALSEVATRLKIREADDGVNKIAASAARIILKKIKTHPLPRDRAGRDAEIAARCKEETLVEIVETPVEIVETPVKVVTETSDTATLADEGVNVLRDLEGLAISVEEFLDAACINRIEDAVKRSECWRYVEDIRQLCDTALAQRATPEGEQEAQEQRQSRRLLDIA